MAGKKFRDFPHVFEAQQFDREWLELFFQEARQMETIVANGGCDLLARKIMVSLFYEPSTRTRLSFEAAMLYLGGQVLTTENAREFSSAVKGETLEDSIRTVCQYRPSVIVLRHHDDGAANKARMVSTVPVINAGDGKGQHPTQALLDIYTIIEELGHVDGITIAMVGDLVNGRTVRSLSYLLSKFKNIKIHFVSPKCAQMRKDIKDYLKKKKEVTVFESTDLREVAGKVDVIYQTRTQKERGATFDRNDSSLGHFIVDKEILGLMQEKSIIMHPLPRVDEITPDVDKDPRAAYFKQVGNGLFARMALLKMIILP